MLEKMADFFEARISDYDEHMLRDIEGASEFYPYTASLLPKSEGAKVLDLGCGTGLELQEYFELNASACITGIDLSQIMLDRLKAKFPDKELKLICDSYFEADMGQNVFDAAVSVESIHHFTIDKKKLLYKKVHDSLKDGGYFILTDYFAPTDELEDHYMSELKRMKAENGLDDDVFYHYDTPLTVSHETEALLCGGFSKVETMKNWENTYTLKAYK